jgi:hypothetical protein
MNAFLRTAIVFTSTAIALTLQAACARSVTSDLESDPSFLSPDAMTPAPLNVCVSTDCPPPWATCGDGLCATDTTRDVEHCGSCANACPHQPPSHHATALCAKSKCEIACEELSADCNHDPADGCEVFTGDDPKNCGGCGNVCKDGDICWKGACGCPTGFTQCGQECKNLASDNLNCGACGSKCVAPPNSDPAWGCGPGVQPSNTTWGCEGGACKQTCMALFGDCNASICTDGCEVDEHTDPNNCGGCGHECGAGQDCVDGTCLCPPGTTRCGSRCIAVNVDPDNCGGCGIGCPGAQDDTANGGPTCTGGRCGYLCYVGFADCDHRLDNGCEVTTGSDPKNCGGCGIKCDSSRGQPCVEGKCLTKPCGPAAGTF